MTRALVATAWLLWLAPASAVLAQSPDDGVAPVPVAPERRLFEEGLQAARQARWDAARVAFAQSYALAPRPITLLNLAGALTQTGRLREGVDAYRRFLALPSDERLARLRATAEAALAATLERIPTLRVQVEGLSPGDRVSLDGDTVAHAALADAIPLDPGRHEIVVAPAHAAARTVTVELAERERATASIDLRAPRAPERPSRVAPRSGRARGRSAGIRSRRRPAPGESSVLESPWLWTALGVVVLGGVGLGVGLSAQPSRDPTRGDLPPYRRGL